MMKIANSIVLASAALYCFSPPAAQAQCIGQLAAGAVCGNPTASRALPRAFASGIQTPIVRLNSSGAATANSTAINAAIQSLGALGGGTVQLPCGGNLYVGATIDNNVSGVLVKACQAGAYSTTLLPNFSGIALKHRTPYGTGSTAQNAGGGFSGFTVSGNSVATVLLEIDSISGGEYDLSLNEAVGTNYNAHITSCISGTNLVLCDVQKMKKLKLIIQQLVSSADGVRIEGSTNANFSGNIDIDFRIIHKDGIAFRCTGADNNVFWFGSFRFPSGTGQAILASGTDASGAGCYGNTFSRLGSSAADGAAPTIYASGTGDSGITGGVNNLIINLDKSNGTTDPTSGTLSCWGYQYTIVNGGMGFYSGVGGGGSTGLAPVIFSKCGAENLEIFPGVSAGVVRLLAYNRTSNGYIAFLHDASQHTWNITSTQKLQLTSTGLGVVDAVTAGTYVSVGTKVRATGSAPVLTSCGTSPAITGSDLAGEVTMGTAAPTGCVITFNSAYASTPYCTVTWQATPLASQSYAVSTTAITLTQTGTSSNKVNYTCVARSGG